MDWQGQIEELREVLGLVRMPVVVNYSVKLTSPQDQGKFMVCEAMLKASQGDFLDLSLETLDCPLAVRALGLGDPSKGQDNLKTETMPVRSEIQLCTPASSQKTSMTSIAPAVRLADHILIGPADRSEHVPDLILFLCNPEQASRLLEMDSYQTGVAPRIEMSGSTCHQMITYPYVTGELNISLLDFNSRGFNAYRPDEMVVTTPYQRFLGIMESLDDCPAGRSLK
jgi:uncharacterized protein (DUF169 family)